MEMTVRQQLRMTALIMLLVALGGVLSRAIGDEPQPDAVEEETATGTDATYDDNTVLHPAMSSSKLANYLTISPNPIYIDRASSDTSAVESLTAVSITISQNAPLSEDIELSVVGDGDGNVTFWEPSEADPEVPQEMANPPRIPTGEASTTVYLHGVTLSGEDDRRRVQFKTRNFGTVEVPLSVYEVDIDIARLEGTVVDEKSDDTTGSITRVVNPYIETPYDPTSLPRFEDISLKVTTDFSQIPGEVVTECSFTFEPVDESADTPQIQLFGSGSTPILSQAGTEYKFDVEDIEEEYYIQFVSTGIIDLKFSVYNGDGDVIGADTVRATGILSTPNSGNIFFVRSGATQGTEFNDYIEDAAGSINEAQSVASDNDNIVVGAGDYGSDSMSTTESATTITKSLVISGLGAEWITNVAHRDSVNERWGTATPYIPSASSMPVLSPGTSERVMEVVAEGDSLISGLRIAGGRIDDDASSDGGAGIYIHECGTVLLEALYISDNRKTREDVEPNQGGGGALITSLQDIEIRDSIFYGNEANGSGGGALITQVATAAEIKRTAFLNNSVTDTQAESMMFGGAVALMSIPSVSIQGVLFDSNWIEYNSGHLPNQSVDNGGYGGGLAIVNMSMNSVDASIDECVFLKNYITAPKNRAAGGGLAEYGDSTGVLSVSIENSDFEENECRSILFSPSAAATPMENSLRTRYPEPPEDYVPNDAEKSDNIRTTGGAIYIYQASLEAAGCDFIDNRVLPIKGPILPAIDVNPSTSQYWGLTHIPDRTAYGGAVAAHKNVELSLNGCLFLGNESIFAGGAIGIVGEREAITGETSARFDGDSQVFDISACIFQANRSVVHGGALVAASDKTTGIITGSTFEGNVSSYKEMFKEERPVEEVDADGGAISYQAAGKRATGDGLLIFGTQFIGNSCEGGGGAIKTGGAAYLETVSCTFVQNKAVCSGGAVRLSSAAHYYSLDDDFLSNQCGLKLKLPPGGITIDTGNGGAVAAKDGRVKIVYGRLIENLSGISVPVGRQGGAVHSVKTWHEPAMSAAFQGEFVGLYWDRIELDGCFVGGNGAGSQGGGVYVRSDYGYFGLRVDRSTFDGNYGLNPVVMGKPALDITDPFRALPAYAGFYNLPILNDTADGIFVEIRDGIHPGGGGGNLLDEPQRLWVEVENSVFQGRGGVGAGIFLKALEGVENDGDCEVINSKFTDFRNGAISATFPLSIERCEFKPTDGSTSFDVKIIDGDVDSGISQDVSIRETLFHPTSSGIGVYVARQYSSKSDYDGIEVNQCVFNGRDLTPNPGATAPAPPLATNGGIVVASAGTSFVDASSCLWSPSGNVYWFEDPSAAPFTPNGGYASRQVDVTPFLIQPPQTYGTSGAIGY